MPFRVVDVQLQIIRSIDGQQTDFASIKTPTRKGEETYLLKPKINYLISTFKKLPYQMGNLLVDVKIRM